MWTTIAGMLFALSAGVFDLARVADAPADLRETIASEFAGVYRFDYLFSEAGILYVDVSGHRQVLESDKHDGAPRITFFNQTAKGEKRPHYSYVFFQKDNQLTLREFDGGGKFPLRLRRDLPARQADLGMRRAGRA